jgi:iron-sulfur cluster repair protein YtfE (RIC family)
VKENSIEEDIARIAKLITTKFSNDYSIDNKDKEAIEHILSAYKRVLKENEELKQDRNNNYQMIALAQNEALGYMQGYEDGKKLKRSAVANIVENQQYYIIKKQIEKYETYIEQLRKELEQKDKIIDLIAETINNYDIDEDVCKQMRQKANCNEYEDAKECKECIKQYFINKAKEIR